MEVRGHSVFMELRGWEFKVSLFVGFFGLSLKLISLRRYPKNPKKSRPVTVPGRD